MSVVQILLPFFACAWEPGFKAAWLPAQNAINVPGNVHVKSFGDIPKIKGKKTVIADSDDDSDKADAAREAAAEAASEAREAAEEKASEAREAAEEKASEAREAAQEKANDELLKACPEWKNYPGGKSYSGSGLFCQKDNQSFKCSKSPENRLIITSCLPDFKAPRMLKDEDSDKADAAREAAEEAASEAREAAEEKASEAREAAEEKASEAAEAAEEAKTTKLLQGCPRWTTYDGSGISGSGLFCRNNGHIYKCTISPNNGITVTDCLPEFKIESPTIMI